jgi:hypothetical protein
MSIQQVEIVTPKKDIPEALGILTGGLIGLAMRVLVVWWAIAAWFPELGITYWQAILPVFAIRGLILPKPLGRALTK